MKRLITSALASCALIHAAYAHQDNYKTVVEIAEDFHPGGCPKCEIDTNRSPQDIYLAAYIQGLIDATYPKSGVIISVHSGEVIISNLPTNYELADSIRSYVVALTSKSKNELDKTLIAQADPEPQAKNTVIDTRKPIQGIWLPQSTVLFPTMVADPRQITFSLGLQFNDCRGGKIAGPVTFGDQFPIYRWANFWGGDLQLEIEGCVFALFNLVEDSAPLINADYYVGIPLSFAKDKWAYRVRIYHISSHLGDEFLMNHHHYNRKNKSFEALDFFASYQMNKVLRFYGGIGSIVHSDSEMKLKPLYAQYGFEARAFRHNFTQLYGQPFLAVNIQNAQDTHYQFNNTYAIGYEFGKIQGIGRKIRIFGEYHKGFSPDGQFSRRRDEFFAIRLAYGF